MIGDILALIEQARTSGNLSNEQASLMEFAAKIEDKDEQVLANRAISRGADPFAIQFLATGQVDDHIRLAHVQGPGSLTGSQRDDWLFLARLSADEHASAGESIRDRLLTLKSAVDCYTSLPVKERQMAIDDMELEIKNLPFDVEEVRGVETQVYTSDLGFASAYWNGLEHAAVRQTDGLLFVGSKGTPLDVLGIAVDKVLSPQFGIIFP